MFSDGHNIAHMRPTCVVQIIQSVSFYSITYHINNKRYFLLIKVSM